MWNANVLHVPNTLKLYSCLLKMLVLVCKRNIFIRGDQMWEVLTSCVSWGESKLRSCNFTWTPWTPSLSWENVEAMTVLLFLQPRLFSNKNHHLLLHWYRGWRCAQKNIVPIYAFVRSVVVVKCCEKHFKVFAILNDTCLVDDYPSQPPVLMCQNISFVSSLWKPLVSSWSYYWEQFLRNPLQWSKLVMTRP